MNSVTAGKPIRWKFLTVVIFIMVLALGIALAWFVNRATTQIRDALAQEVLQQQHDVANLLHEYAGVMIAVARQNNFAEYSDGSIRDALQRAQRQLELMRFQYSFERLDGAATAHAFVKPVLQDVSQWIEVGLYGQSVDYQTILKLSSRRLTERYAALRAIAEETDNVAELLIASQSDYLNRFSRSLISLLGFYAILVMGVVALLIRQRNLQTQLRLDQERYAERITDFADIGADWFWEMTDELKLSFLSDRELPLPKHPADAAKAVSDTELRTVSGQVSELHWPVHSLREQRAFSDYESEWISPQHERRVIAMSGKPLYELDGKFIGFRGVGRDITERKNMEQELKNVYRELLQAQSQSRQLAEDALRDSEQFLSTSLDAITPSIAIIDQHGTIRATNKSWRDLTAQAVEDGGAGLHYVLALNARPKSEQQKLANIEQEVDDILAGGKQRLHRDFAFETGDDTCWMEINLTAFSSNGQRYAVLVYQDISERRKLEERDRRLLAELAHEARINTAGEMASVLAHEINQPLTAISYNCDALLAEADVQSAEMRETLQDIYEQSQRAGGIIHSMRQMMRKESPGAKRVDINQLVRETSRLTTPEARESQVAVVLDLAEKLPRISIDPVQIQQVLVNLQRNGVEAMRTRDSGRRELTISTRLRNNDNIEVCVTDTGTGLTPEIEKSLFKSFRTTKSDGMGMGLSISRSIVEAHGGRLWLNDTTEGMTTFTFCLPVKESQDIGNARKHSPRRNSPHR